MKTNFKSNTIFFTVAAILFVISLLGSYLFTKGVGYTDEIKISNNTNRGKFLYTGMCASCHGAEGRADGYTVSNLKVPPRDFTLSEWKYGRNLDAIKKVIKNGIPASGMPACKELLAEKDLQQLAEYVLLLSDQNPSFNKTPFQKSGSTDGFTILEKLSTPDLKLSDVSGKEFNLHDLKNNALMLHFWGINCPHCLKDLQQFQKLEEMLKGKPFKVLHICTDEEDPKIAQEIAEKYAPGIQICVEVSGVGLARYEVQSLPLVWLIDTHGKPLGKWIGTRNWQSESINQKIEKAIHP